MDNFANSLTLLYAIVEQVRPTSDPERFVIAYRTEQSLHDFLVASCIVGSGYRSREEASRDCENCESHALPVAA
jgi:hypothetical protein